jgi:glycosyltransferase involved in cell wall biosynthesis
MWFPLNLIGYLIEPIYLYLLSKNKVITISKSTKKDLLNYGFNEQNIEIISEGIDIKPIENINLIKKNSDPTILSLGSIRAMKRTLDQIKSFEIAKKDIKNLKMIIAGNSEGSYGNKVINYIKNSKYKNDIQYLGKITEEEKIKIMQKCQIILVTSTKEGWGLIITEANSQGTPGIVYNVDGLRDSVKDNITGLICKNNNPVFLANEINELLTDKTKYKKLQTNALAWSKKINFQNSYQDFIKIISNDR